MAYYGLKGIAMSKSLSFAQWAIQPYSIGLKLRLLRTQKRLTLARLASETGLSTALLSKLETDRMIPTLPTLATISRVYGVGMSYFFREAERHTLSITRKAHLGGHERGMEQVRVMPLNAPGECTAPDAAAMGSGGQAHRQGPRLVAQMIELGAGGASSSMDCLRQSCGMLYVLEGKMQLDSGGLHEVLEEGDCAYVESDLTLVWSAAGKHRCRVLAVFAGVEPAEL